MRPSPVVRTGSGVRANTRLFFSSSLLESSSSSTASVSSKHTAYYHTLYDNDDHHHHRLQPHTTTHQAKSPAACLSVRAKRTACTRAPKPADTID
ncbi:unnamed protein product [Mesocestoides corti]|uniref:Secreted protein n=1 Tax=Mesocestoides corti TaxID=53468 RepID=A0A0R3UJW3_MESCO|nr:unnamed protein product [Mesocestoides corti]